jgi:hypothetical protein
MEERMTVPEDMTVQDPRTLDRRQFSLAAALAVLSGVAITISSSSCSSGSSMPTTPNPTPTPGGTPGDKTGVISNNHGHVAVITGAQLTAANALQLDIRGTASHTHNVSLSAAEIASIAANQRIAKESSTEASHSHTVTFN